MPNYYFISINLTKRSTWNACSKASEQSERISFVSSQTKEIVYLGEIKVRIGNGIWVIYPKAKTCTKKRDVYVAFNDTANGMWHAI